jgi:hypothetical protein
MKKTLLTKTFIFVLSFPILISCSSRKSIVSKEELISYINKKENGLKQEQEVNGIKVSLTYQPGSLLVARELEDGQGKDADLVKGLESKYDSNYYFFLKFSRDNKEAIRQLGSFGRYSDMVQVLAFQMHNFINLTTPQRDTLALGDYLFDQTYGMSDGNTLLLSFSKEKVLKSSALEINIGECGFGTGSMKFILDKKDIENMPKLDYSGL